MNGIRKQHTRSKSPFRARRIGKRVVAPPLSPWSRRSVSRENEEDVKNERFKIHESEINVFQQLCLGKHDENAAIEILLDSPNDSSKYDASFSDYSDVGPTFPLSSTQEPESIEKNSTFSTASMSTERKSSVHRKQDSLDEHPKQATPSRSIGSGSRELSKKKAGGMEAKRTFLNRFFFKSMPKQNSDAAFPVVVNTPRSLDENALPSGNLARQSKCLQTIELNAPKPKNDFGSTFRATTSSGKWSTPTPSNHQIKTEAKMESNATVLSERFDSFSNMSDLSGSLATSYRKMTPFQRQQSLGIESIKDIRMCLKEMETQLAQASNNGQRVSRHKLIKALFTVADSLDDSDEKTQVKAQLEDAMNGVQHQTSQLQTQNEEGFEDGSGSECVSTGSEEDFTYDGRTFGDEEEEDKSEADEASPFNIMSFFGVSSDNQEVIGEALDDLMWNDFISSRKEKERSKAKHIIPDKTAQYIAQTKSRKIALQVNDYGSSSINRAQNQNLSHASKPQRTRSWWRNHPAKSGADCEHNREDDEEGSSIGSEEFPSYLPTSVTLPKKLKKTVLGHNARPTEFAQTSSKYKVKVRHQQQQPQLIETESRIGYEMGSANKAGYD